MPFADFEELRAARNAALGASDYLLLDDAPYPKDRRDLALAYRQELRDLPKRAEAVGLELIELPDYSHMFRPPADVGEPLVEEEPASEAEAAPPEAE